MIQIPQAIPPSGPGGLMQHASLHFSNSSQLHSRLAISPPTKLGSATGQRGGPLGQDIPFAVGAAATIAAPVSAATITPSEKRMLADVDNRDSDWRREESLCV